MAEFWRECCARLPRWPWLFACPGPCGDLEHSKCRELGRAELDICRLRWNWLFAMLISMIESLNISCVLPTNHRYVINPTPDNLNSTTSTEEIEPGLQLGEDFYSLSYSTLFIGDTLAAVICGLLFNHIPTWYLFLSSILLHITSFTLYSLATGGWMMLLSRALAGLAMGSSVTAVFSYFGVSHFKYVENMKELDRYEQKAAARTKGFIFSLYNIGNLLGYAIGGGFPIILAQFPETPQFRPAGWFCVAVGVTLLLLLLLLFHGEYAWHCSSVHCPTKPLASCTEETVDVEKFCSVFIPVFLIVIGGVKGIRYLIPTVMMAPIASDSFGYSEKDSAYLITIFFVGTLLGIILTYILQYFKVSSYALTVTGMVCTIIAFLMMADWQAIGNDPCTAYSLFRRPQLLDYYREQLRESKKLPVLHNKSDYTEFRVCLSTIESMEFNISSDVQGTSCALVNSCDLNGADGSRAQAIFNVKHEEPTHGETCFEQVQSHEKVRVQTLVTARELSNFKERSSVHCSSALGPSSSEVSSCFLMDDKNNESIDDSLLAWVHVQSWQVVEEEVYQLAVNRCESAGKHCHWIPNSKVTHKHCSDCLPICRDSRRTLHFAQFAIGLTFFFSTFTFLFTGFFLLLSDTVSRTFQGPSIGSLVAISGFLKIVAPYWMFHLYKEAEMRTYLLMLTMVGIYLPILMGLLLAHSWIKEQLERQQEAKTETEKNGNELSELLPPGIVSDTDSS